MSSPTRRERTRPAELLGLAAILAVVLGAVVLMATRDIVLALEFAGVGFIAALVVFATLLIAVTPKGGDGPGGPDDGGRGGH